MKTVRDEVSQIGFGVRRETELGLRSQDSSFRNPPDHLVLADLLEVLSAFNKSEVVWFGAHSHFKSIMDQLQTRHLRSRVRYQKTKKTLEAHQEVQDMVLWFQRWGGGIGLPFLFSEKPYLFISNDVVATSLFFNRSGMFGSWSKNNQTFSSYALKPDRSARHLLRKLAKQQLK